MLFADVVDRIPLNDPERDAILREQHTQLKELGTSIDAQLTCPCGKIIRIALAFKCFHCWIWFYRDCAERHFGSSK